MIGLTDSLTLARTKLKTKKLLLSATIAIAALSFGIIIAGMIVVTGASRSADTYLKTALNDKYLVLVNPVIPSEVYGFGSMVDTPPDSLRSHLLDLQDQYIKEQEVLADKYGIAFDSDVIDPILKPNPFGQKDSLGNIKEVINRQAPAYQLYLAELQDTWLKTSKATLPNLKLLAKENNATDFYQNRYATTSYIDTFYLPGGKEDINKVVEPESAYDYYSAVKNSSYTFTDQSLVNRYILPENQVRKDNKTALPVVITKQEAVKLFGEQLGLAKEPENPKEKIVWMKTLQEKINGLTYEACYRSPAEVALIQETMRYNQVIASQSDDMLAPAVTYNLPASACAPLTVKEDRRTETQKDADEKMTAYQKAAGTYQPLVTQRLTFQVIGVMSIASTDPTNLNDFSTLMNNMLGTQFTAGAFIPNQLYEKLTLANQHKDILQAKTDSFGLNDEKLKNAGVISAIVAFPSAQDAKKFIDTNTCLTMDQSSCKKLWTSQLYGANFLLVDDIGKKVGDLARLVLPIALTVAAIVMCFTMARVIIDSRHETAIFRALGAKRIDIMRVYLTYSLMVAVIVTVASFVLGFAGAFVIEVLYGPDITSYAKVAYGVFDGLGNFTFIGVNGLLLGLIVVAIFVVAVIAVLPPLVRNVRRSPIKDMRDDN